MTDNLSLIESTMIPDAMYFMIVSSNCLCIDIHIDETFE